MVIVYSCSAIAQPITCHAHCVVTTPVHNSIVKVHVDLSTSRYLCVAMAGHVRNGLLILLSCLTPTSLAGKR